MTTISVHVLARFHDGWRMCVTSSLPTVRSGAVEPGEVRAAAALRHVAAETGYEARLVAALSPDGHVLPLSDSAERFVAVADRAYFPAMRVASVQWLRESEVDGSDPLAGRVFGQIEDLVTAPAVQRDEELRRELLRRHEKDQAARLAWWTDRSEPNRLRVLEVDRENLPWLKELVLAQGWPSTALVGEDGAEAAWYLSLHADLDKAFQLHCVDLLGVAVTEGAVPAKHLAYLEDRVRVFSGRPQIFATLVWTNDEGRNICYSTVDPETVHERRADWGLANLPPAEFQQVAEMS
ncbi:hypothetical protein LFM09_47215 [Lentzea alba]|uniref:DUF6624 domain-containing protein n=1 Tax=Lentzea alba TaxID=2714351 RepID=UPI0039BF908B